MAYYTYSDGKHYDSVALAALTTDRERAEFWKKEAMASHRRANNLRDAVGPPSAPFAYLALIAYAIIATAVAVLT